MVLRSFVFISLLLFISLLSATEIVRIQGPQSEYDASHDYYKGLVALAFKKTISK